MNLSQSQYNLYFGNVFHGIFSICFAADKRSIVLFCGKILLSVGAAVDTVHIFGRTALMEATVCGHNQIAEVKSPMRVCYNHKTTCILRMICLVYFSICCTAEQTLVLPLRKTLLSAGAAADKADNDGWTALMMAAKYGNFLVSQVSKLIIICSEELIFFFCSIQRINEYVKKCFTIKFFGVSPTATCEQGGQCSSCQQDR